MSCKINEIKIKRTLVYNEDPFVAPTYQGYTVFANECENDVLTKHDMDPDVAFDNLIEDFPDTWKEAKVYTVSGKVIVGVFGEHKPFIVAAPIDVEAIYDAVENQHVDGKKRVDYVEPKQEFSVVEEAEV